MLNDLPSDGRLAEAERLAGIIRLIRRICLLREQGGTAEANRLQAGELVAAVAEFRLWHGPGNLTEEKICALFVNETELVREAMVLAHIMAPDLATLASPHQPAEAPVFPPVRPLGSIKPFPDGPPAIGDLLDAMLAAKPPQSKAPPANE